MGTRADFYVGKGKTAEWLGSIAWDGDTIPDAIRKAGSEADYRSAVDAFLKSREDATVPEQGWPWPWDTSATTDCHYWFFDGKVHAGGFRKWEHGFPDMSGIKNVTLGPRSGTIVFVR